jgi:cell division protein FtsB
MSLFAHPSRESGNSWLTSLAFWLCLFAAAALYTTVTLAPKLLVFLTLNREYHANQWKLVSLKKQVDHLQKVIDAQKNDPAFVREQARSDFDVANPDEQRISVDSHLRLNIGTGNADLAVAPAELPWYAPLLATIARSRSVSNTLLGIAAILVLYAFALLYERSSGLT